MRSEKSHFCTCLDDLLFDINKLCQTSIIAMTNKKTIKLLFKRNKKEEAVVYCDETGECLMINDTTFYDIEFKIG